MNQSKDLYYQIPKETSQHPLPLWGNPGLLKFTHFCSHSKSTFSIPGTIHGTGFLGHKTQSLSSRNVQLVEGTTQHQSGGRVGGPWAIHSCGSYLTSIRQSKSAPQQQHDAPGNLFLDHLPIQQCRGIEWSFPFCEETINTHVQSPEPPYGAKTKI